MFPKYGSRAVSYSTFSSANRSQRKSPIFICLIFDLSSVLNPPLQVILYVGAIDRGKMFYRLGVEAKYEKNK